jgi:hypothetical protein
MLLLLLMMGLVTLPKISLPLPEFVVAEVRVVSSAMYNVRPVTPILVACSGPLSMETRKLQGSSQRIVPAISTNVPMNVSSNSASLQPFVHPVVGTNLFDDTVG